MEIKKYPLNSFYLAFDYDKHNEQKENLLSLINESPSEKLEQHDEYYGDFINRLDWPDKNNPERPWVKFFLSGIINTLNDLTYSLGYNGIYIHDMWFQQYIKNSTHGWHTHGANFTGVYYLELDDSSPKTELICPWSHNLFVPEIQEGTVLIFPSYVIHRAPIINDDVRKTIISFNADFGNPTKDFLSYLTKRI